MVVAFLAVFGEVEADGFDVFGDAEVAEDGLGCLDHTWRLATRDLPTPYSPSLEDAFLPGSEAIVRSVLTRLR